MATMYKAKFRSNGVTYYINTRSEAKRDRAVEFHRRAGIDVEVYQTETPDPVVATTEQQPEQQTAEAVAGIGSVSTSEDVASSPF